MKTAEEILDQLKIVRYRKLFIKAMESYAAQFKSPSGTEDFAEWLDQRTPAFFENYNFKEMLSIYQQETQEQSKKV